MNTKNVIDEVFNDIETGQFDRANGLLSDNFKGILFGKDVNRPAYLSAYRSLLKGIPDLRLDIRRVRTEGSKVTAKLKVSGTNSRDIPALVKGWQEIPATHKTVKGLIMDLEITMKDDKIEEIRNSHNTRGLFVSLFENLGMDYKKFQVN